MATPSLDPDEEEDDIVDLTAEDLEAFLDDMDAVGSQKLD